MLSGVNTMMWRTQDILHKKPQVVPGTLLAMAGSALVYHHMNSDVEIYQSDPIKTFLAMIIVQMLPLVALEMKIMSCADPVGLFCKFATPVTLIHVFFLAMRLVMYANYDSQTLSTSAVALVGAIVTIVKGYRQSWLNVIECGTVWGLITLAFLAALSTTSLDSYMKPEWQTPSWERFFSSAFETANAYIEIIAFVPAVWMVFCEDKNSARVEVDSMDTKRTSTAFFLFLVGFYVTEDLLNAYSAWEMSPPASFAHCAHFALLVDFSFYVLAHIYNPEKLMGELRKWLPVDVYHEV